MLNIIKAVSVIIGTVIGAGFASGREIYIFFNIYGIKGIIGTLIASILIGIIIYKVLKQIKGKNITNYSEYISKIGFNKKVESILGSVINIFLLISFYIMVAGFCAYFKQEYQWSPFIIGIAVSLMCYFTFMNKIDGVTKINTILIPILIIMIIWIAIKNGFYGLNTLVQKAQIQKQSQVANWLISSFQYASYNSIVLIPILLGLKRYTLGKEKIISIISSCIFCCLSIILYNILLGGGLYIQNIDLPLVYIVKSFGIVYQYICGIIVVLAIFTSAVAAGYGFLQNSTKTKKGYSLMAKCICISSIFVSQIGFSQLINSLYPIFGLISIIQILYIFKHKAEC